LSKTIKNCFDYIFLLVYNEFKKLYPEHLDPAFYSIMFIYVVFIALLSPAIYLFFDVKLQVEITKLVWILCSFIVMIVFLKYFKKDRIKIIEKRFEDKALRKTYKWITVVTLLIIVVFYFIALEYIHE